MCARRAIVDVCPGCGTPLLHGAIVDAMESTQQYDRIWGLTQGITLDECDAIYLGDLIVNDVLKCPRCNANCVVNTKSTAAATERSVEQDFLGEAVVDLDLSIRARSLINRAGAETVAELLKLSWADLRSVAQEGEEPKIIEIRRFLEFRHLNLRDQR